MDLTCSKWMIQFMCKCWQFQRCEKIHSSYYSQRCGNKNCISKVFTLYVHGTSINKYSDKVNDPRDC
jgi:hypothetical protein